MIDNCLGIDTEGGTLDTMVFSIECGMQRWFFLYLKDRSSLQYFITQGMGQSSMFLIFCTICNFRGRTSALGRVGRGKGGIPG